MKTSPLTIALLIMGIPLLVFALLIVAAGRPERSPEIEAEAPLFAVTTVASTHAMGTVFRFDDTERNMTCYVYDANRGGGIWCQQETQ